MNEENVIINVSAIKNGDARKIRANKVSKTIFHLYESMLIMRQTGRVTT